VEKYIFYLCIHVAVVGLASFHLVRNFKLDRVPKYAMNYRHGDHGAVPHPVPDLRSGRLFYFIIGVKREGLGRET